MPVLHAKALWDRAKLLKTEPLVQMAGVDIALYHRVKLEDAEPLLFCGLDTV